jgi:hypothetical protein
MYKARPRPKYCSVNITTIMQELINEEGSVELCKGKELLRALQHVIEEVIQHYNKN